MGVTIYLFVTLGWGFVCRGIVGELLVNRLQTACKPVVRK